MEQPRVNPENWANRRKHAVDRARELRSRRKEEGPKIEPSDSSSVSKSELQRQRRSRQLEATQRLLDAQQAEFNFASSSSGSRGSANRDSSDKESTLLLRESFRDDRSIEASSRHGDSKSHSIISRKSLGRLRENFQHSAEFDQIVLDTERVAINESSRDLQMQMSRRDDVSENIRKRMKPQIVAPKSGSSATSELTSSVRSLRERDERANLGERPQEGRGRGRGRRKHNNENSALGLAEQSQTSRSVTYSSFSNKSSIHDRDESPVDNFEMPTSKSMPNFDGTRSVSSTIQESRCSQSNVKVNSYLRDRQVPGFKEGECEKLAILRERLVARRRKRSKSHSGSSEKENNSFNPRPVIGGGNHHGCLQQQTFSRTKTSSFDVKYEDANTSIRKSKGCREVENIGMNRMNVSGSIDGNERSHDSSSAGDDIADKNYEDIMQYTRQQRELNVGDDEGSIGANRTNDSGDHEKNRRRHSNIGSDDDQSVVEIKTIQCDCCKRSFAPKVYEKHFDSDGKPKCEISMKKKRPVFNSAKARISNNENLNSDEKRHVLKTNKKVAKELANKSGGTKKKIKNKSSKWREESNTFREAMRASRLIAKAEIEGKPAHYYL